MSDRPPAPPPGWYPDASDPTIERYWDGGAWTERTREAAAWRATAPPSDASPPEPDATPSEPEPPRSVDPPSDVPRESPAPQQLAWMGALGRRWERLPTPGRIGVVAAPILLVILIAIVSSGGGDGGGGSSGNDALREAGVEVDTLGLWSYHVTCGQITDYPDIVRPTATELAEELNSPVGKQAAIDAIAENLPLACEGVSPDYEPGEDAFDAAEDELGG